MYYKDQSNALYFLDDATHEYLLPAGCVQITDAEAEAIRAATAPVETTQDKLNALDAANTLTQRNLRETIMLMAEAFKAVSNNSVDLSQIPGVKKVYEVEAQAQSLRAQL
jgi:hypothetical protein